MAFNGLFIFRDADSQFENIYVLKLLAQLHLSKVIWLEIYNYIEWSVYKEHTSFLWFSKYDCCPLTWLNLKCNK